MNHQEKKKIKNNPHNRGKKKTIKMLKYFFILVYFRSSWRSLKVDWALKKYQSLLLLKFSAVHQKCQANRVQGADLRETSPGSLCPDRSKPKSSLALLCHSDFMQDQGFVSALSFVKASTDPCVICVYWIKTLTMANLHRFVLQVIQSLSPALMHVVEEKCVFWMFVKWESET